MNTNEIPAMNMDTAETKCCPKFLPESWDKQKLEFDKKLFVKGKTWSIFHIPMNIGSMYKKICKRIEEEKAQSKDNYLVMSHDLSMWKAEHLFAVEKDIPGEEMVKLSGKFLTKVFEGPYSQMGKWMKEMTQYVESKDEKVKKMYFFYVTCPGCAKKYGKNYVVGIAQI